MNDFLESMSHPAAEPIFGGPPLPLRPYQEQPVHDIVSAVLSGKKEVLVAACQSFGKTEVVIEVIRRLLCYGHVRNVLVLAHGMTSIRKNFEERLEKWAPALLKRVTVALPQSSKSIEGQYDIVVVDEAHHFYEVDEGMVQNLIAKVGAKQVILMTATPSPFIKRGLKPTVIFSLCDLQAVDGGRWVHDIRIDLATCAYDLKKDDWTTDGEAKEKIRYTKNATEKTLADLIKALGHRADFAKQKTIIACANKRMARLMSAALDRRRLVHMVSISGDKADEDTAGKAMERFREPGSPSILVAIKRAGLGYDLPELINFVDITLSKNPGRIWQMEGRLIRPMPGVEKAFIKVMPSILSEKDLGFYMSGVQALGQREILGLWNGENFMGMRIPFESEGGEQAKTNEDGQGMDASPTKRPVLMSGMMLFGDYFAAIAPSNGEPVFATARLGVLLNSRRQHAITARGKTKSANEWSKETGISESTIIRRWLRGLREEELFAMVRSVSQRESQRECDVCGNLYSCWKGGTFCCSRLCSTVRLRARGIQKQQEIIRFWDENQRWPIGNKPSGSVESRLHGLMQFYIKHPHSETFLRELRSRGWTPLNERVELFIGEVLAFWKTHGRWPARSDRAKAGNGREYRLSQQLQSWLKVGNSRVEQAINNIDPNRLSALRGGQRVPKNKLMLTVDGKTMSVADWARETGLKPGIILQRRRCGKIGKEIVAPYKRKHHVSPSTARREALPEEGVRQEIDGDGVSMSLTHGKQTGILDIFP